MLKLSSKIRSSETRNLSSETAAGRRIRKLDKFGHEFKMKLDNSNLSKKSFMGTFLTIWIAMTTFMFFYAKTITIVEKHDVDIMSALIDNDIDDDYRF